jgi:predicted nucleic acid-binding protein
VQAVIDASYFIEFLNSPFEEKFQWVLGCKLITTELFIYEIHNVLLKALKIKPEELHKFRSILDDIDIHFRNVKKHEHEMYKLAFSHSLSFYDASYLWLSLGNNMPIATYDKAIIRAANDLQINVIE